jgi:biopolymer transport protein ExbD
MFKRCAIAIAIVCLTNSVIAENDQTNNQVFCVDIRAPTSECFVNDLPVECHEVGRRLKRKLKAARSSIILIRPDSTVRYGPVSKALGSIQKAGFKHVEFRNAASTAKCVA